jgi:uncharacterized protein YndB with AHSA1/START domain
MTDIGTRETRHDLIVTRVFDAPLERVWKAWSDSDDVLRWWGPAAFTAPLANMDFREGGTSLVSMRSPDGHDLYNTWTYRQIVPLQRIEFILQFADKDGNTLDPAQLGLPPAIPREVRHVVTFEAQGQRKTRIAVTEYGYASEHIVEVSRVGLEQCLDKMAAIFVRV